jgi:hypothetical protein
MLTKEKNNMAKKQIIRLTEGDLHRIIKESVNKILKEDYQITLSNSGKQGLTNMHNWVAAMNEIKTKGETIIHIPLDYDYIIDARLYKTERGGIYLETKDIHKEYASINDAFLALKGYAEELNNK